MKLTLFALLSALLALPIPLSNTFKAAIGSAAITGGLVVLAKASGQYKLTEPGVIRAVAAAVGTGTAIGAVTDAVQAAE
jgi:hypothetical protein